MHASRPLALAVLLALSALACGAEFFVAPDGDDANPGTRERPFGTLQRAQLAARTAKGDGHLMVFVRGGTFRLREPLVFTAQDSGVSHAEIFWQAVKGETPVISGGVKLDLK